MLTKAVHCISNESTGLLSLVQGPYDVPALDLITISRIFSSNINRIKKNIISLNA